MMGGPDARERNAAMPDTAPPAPATLDAATHAWLREQVGDLPVVPMGEASARLYAVGGDLVLRVFHDAERLAADPWYRPDNEARALRLLAAAPVSTPVLVAARPNAPEPALLTTRVPGTPEPPSDTDALLGAIAQTLAAVHRVDAAGAGLARYAPYYGPTERIVPAWTTREHVWRRAIAALESEPPPAAHGLIHRDFHTAQLLWNGDAPPGVVDWTTACVGPRGIDLARVRLDLALAHGVAVAEEFLPVYARAFGTAGEHHPYWDLLDAADALVDWPEPRDAREVVEWQRFEAWVGRAVRTLART